MEYMVTGPDGKEYGPASIDTLKEWVQDNRLRPESMLRDFHSGQVLPASQVPGLFAMAPPVAGNPYAYQQPPQTYTPPTYATTASSDGNGEFWGSIIRSVLAVAVFFALHGLGLIFAAYALYYAIQAKAHGNKYGTIAIIVASIALATVGIGWFLRISSGTY
jgi:hypothetical protein